MHICKVFRARVVDMGPEALLVEIAGEQAKIDGLVVLLKPFGIIEMVNSGVVAMGRAETFSTPTVNVSTWAERAASAFSKDS